MKAGKLDKQSKENFDKDLKKFNKFLSK